MKRVQRQAHYVVMKRRGLQFLNVNAETNAKTLTSCPHDVTLFISEATANKFASELREQVGSVIADGVVGVCTTRTNAPLVLSGRHPS